MIVYCSADENLASDFCDTSVVLTEESISLCDAFRKLSVDLPVKYIFNYNPPICVNFSGSMRDFMNYLHDVLQIHYTFSTNDDQLVVEFTECNSLRYYELACVNTDISDLLNLISTYSPHVFQLGGRMISVRASCKNHDHIAEIIDRYNELGKLYMEIEFATLDIYTFDKFDYNCINFIRRFITSLKKVDIVAGPVVMATESWDLFTSLGAVVNEISNFLEENKKGHCQVTSNTFCTLFNNSSIEVNTGVDDASNAYVKNRANNLTNLNYDKNKSYIRLTISGQCFNKEYVNLKFVIQNKCELTKDRACVNDSVVHCRLRNGEICYLLDRNGGGSVSEKTLVFASGRQYTVRTIILVRVSIKEQREQDQNELVNEVEQ